MRTNGDPGENVEARDDERRLIEVARERERIAAERQPIAGEREELAAKREMLARRATAPLLLRA
jgi:hypothetical protein